MTKAEELIAIARQSYDYEARECLNRLRGGEEDEDDDDDDDDDDKKDKEEEEEEEDDGWSVWIILRSNTERFSLSTVNAAHDPRGNG